MTEKKEGKKPERGWFITFEGGEGAGKSTQIGLLKKALVSKGYDVLTTREPGGSIGGEAVRHVLLSGAAERFGPDMEALLFAAARSDHVETLIRSALEAGTTVLCDRFIDSTRVYQGDADGVDLRMLARLERVACEDCWPDLTLILDLDPETGMARAEKRRQGGAAPDRFEKEAIDRQNDRRQAYLDIAKAEPERCVVIDASGEAADVHKRVWKAVKRRMQKGSPGWLNPRMVGESA